MNEPVSRLIASLDSRGYTLILGSNTNACTLPIYRRQFATTLDLFDALVLSYEVGCMKPDARFYDACVEAAGVPRGLVRLHRRHGRERRGCEGGGLAELAICRDTPGLIASLRELGSRSRGRGLIERRRAARSRNWTEPVARAKPRHRAAWRAQTMKPSRGSKYSLCRRPLDLRSRLHGILGRRELEERVDLKAGASPQGIFDGDPARADVAGGADLQRQPGERSVVLSEPEGREQAEIAVAQVGAAVGDAALAVESRSGSNRRLA